MNILNLFKIALKALLRNKTRASLTMLGIIIGIASVIAMVSLGQSSSQSINNQISSMGTNLITIMRNNQRQAGVPSSTNIPRLRARDVDAIMEQAQNVSMASPVVNASGQLINGSNNWPGNIQGGNTHLLDIRRYELESGTNFTEQDVRTASKVCIIGLTVVENLFPNGENPVGQTIRFGRIPLKVIGTLVPKGQNQMEDMDDVVIVPYTTVQRRVLAIDFIHNIVASATSESVVNDAVGEIESTLRAQQRTRPGQPDGFRVRTQQEWLDTMDSTSQFLTILLGIVAFISLVVGGIGIMNIMLVTVTERTKEIGLRMSIGAHKRDILLQFLCESTILSLIGGVIGILLGLLLSYLGASFLNWPFILNVPIIIISFLFCGVIGIFFGLYPAMKAASLDPINALRYE